MDNKNNVIYLLDVKAAKHAELLQQQLEKEDKNIEQFRKNMKIQRIGVIILTAITILIQIYFLG